MAAAKSTVSGFTLVQELEGIREFTFDNNGLQVLLAKDDSVPVAGCMITYHVGSRNEATGYTGATHLLEHLMFKESKNFNEKNGKPLKWYLESKGAEMNATTFLDRTNYYHVLPSTVLLEAIELEADRMRNLRLTEKDRADEMPIVRNEFERIENLPLEALDKQLWALAYQAHPYHHSTIGWRSDIENVPIERLQQFYDDFYWPDNATLSIAGSFNEEQVLEHIKKHFGTYTRAPKPYPALYTEEPLQEGERRSIIKRTGNNMIGVAHKIPDANHSDAPALEMLSILLAGDKTSRLYRAFVDTAKATGLNAVCWAMRDPSLFSVFISLTPNSSHKKAEELLKSEYEKIITKGITASELSHAKKLLRTYFAGRRDGPYALLSALNEEIATGNWTRFVTLPKSLQEVTAKDIQRVAKKYLVDDQSSVGWFINTAK